ncbi:bifunctional diguanylate cyclase/phosphodiesterase [Cyanobacterium aponinum]|uniref:EAL domain-containing protein n=1 Tax=Cyanobacterium aponinum 0216 TaxID=2676140 RepID=A0A844GZW5_9CHRO|nr:EAL domain-containing protein [Cyanobacterium aponinum]MTF39506.1 EAL domain-containing protein [Cyanobacterium aponinum 0216]
MKKFISLRTKILISYTVVFTLFFLCLYWWSYRSSMKRSLERLTNNLKQVAIASSQQIDTEELKQLFQEGKANEEGSSDDPRYKSQLQWMEKINQLHPNIFLFTFTHPNISQLSPTDKTEIIYLVDVWRGKNPQKSVDFLESAPATSYHLQTLAEGATVYRNFYKDKWGSWITYYAPIRDSSGQIIAGIGADMQTEEINEIQKDIRERFLSFFVISYPIFFCSIIGLSHFLTTRLGKLQKYAQAVGEGNYQPDIDISDTNFMFSVFRDERMVLSKALREMAGKIKQREDLLNGIFNQVAVGIAIHDVDYRLEIVNNTLCKLLDYSENELRQQSGYFFIHPEDTVSTQEYLREICFSTNLNPTSVEKRIITKKGEVKWLEITTTIIGEREKQCFVTIFQDVTKRRFMETKLIEAANTDFLTKLPNRAYFMATLENLLQEAKNTPHQLFALLLVDLDNFKTINDSLGHLAGDKFLIDIAYSLRRCLSSSHMVARLGGDEFAILLDSITKVEDAIAVAEKIQVEISSPFYIHNQEFFTTCSIGIVLSHNQTTNSPYLRAEDLFRDADIAMYQVKNKGKGDYQVFGREMYDDFIRRLQLQNDLRKSIEKDNLIIYYQPIIDLKTGKITSIESLVRWQHPELGFLNPNKFLPIAEQSGLMISLGKLVLNKACNQLKQWQEANLIPENVCINVNVSEQQFEQGNILQQIKDVLNKTQISPHNLRIEITESIIAHQIQNITKILSEIKKLGVKIAIDDFGTGYSSLARLRNFPLNQIKIDKAFVKPLNTHPKNIKFLQGIITLCHNLELNVVCEGIETETQLEILQKLNCNYGQGYLFSKPLSREEFSLWIINQT